jgi:BirA family transcriptional regulator, biotin operon repressor / biotin---[acetyl-CoA-carboxylase] ligase
MPGATGPLPADVRRFLATARLGRRIYFYPESDSTNDVALALARAGEPEGTLVAANFQRRGRGRRTHAWTSPPGRDVLASLILRPGGDARGALPVALLVALATSIALSKLLDVEVGVKWPNDVIASGGKLAGVLAESASAGGALSHLVVGIGVNVNTRADEFPPGLRMPAVSCLTLTGSEWERAFVLADIVGTVESYYDRFRRDGFGPLASAYESRLLQRGRTVAFESGGERLRAQALGVGPDGALRVRLERDGSEALLYGETVEAAE